MPGLDPTQKDLDKEDWFQPDNMMIRPSKLDAKVALIQKAQDIQKTDNILQLLKQKVQQNISSLKQKLISHYSTR